MMKMNLGIKEETVRPYKEDISKCLVCGAKYSNLTFNINIEDISPIVKNQKPILTAFLVKIEGINAVMDCSQ